ncbi:hypothetical protein Nepgr_031929 [Nepenthes gracilis]|uniref:Bromo domain-containing protein n=1 Tax=Nepenthes gracilis TaxID=150966 RepID=A0AAD3TJ25_NEPGR|nr:hypothetical protein Nepgr_031929 [Nepenthes gracilis]
MPRRAAEGRQRRGSGAAAARGKLRRRSPRISAISGRKGPQPAAIVPVVMGHTNPTGLDEVCGSDDGLGPTNCTRSEPIKQQGPDVSRLPEKRILELILDILQRRDTYEIFAEPVDPSEVEDYYEIIEKPMDFGTMRAKLHEGMYVNLQQFEHDVFLIFRNAMHFNSSSTKYFRQVKQHDFGYKESIMSFVKDLGPIAQRVAKRKLHGLWNNAFISRSSTTESSDVTSDIQMPATQSPFQTKPISFNNPLTIPLFGGFLVHQTEDTERISKIKEAQFKLDGKVSTTGTLKLDAELSSHKTNSHALREGSTSIHKSSAPSSSCHPINARYINSPFEISIQEARNNHAEASEVEGLQYKKIGCFNLNQLDDGGAQPCLPSFPLATQFMFDLPYLESKLSGMSSFKELHLS